MEMEYKLEKFRLDLSSCFRVSSKKKIDINGRGLFSLCKFRIISSFICSKMALCMAGKLQLG